MANQIGIRYNPISWLLSKLKQAVAFANTEKISVHTFPAELFPSRFNRFGNFPKGSVNFIGIKKNHTLYVSFRKKSDPITATDYMVTFQGVNKSHTLHALFEYKPWPLLDLDTILLLHFFGQIDTKNYVDTSIYENSVGTIPTGQSKITNVKRKWGKTACLINGQTIGQYADDLFVNWKTSAGSLEGKEDFTIDFWFYDPGQTYFSFNDYHYFVLVGDSEDITFGFGISKDINSIWNFNILVANDSVNRSKFPSSNPDNVYLVEGIEILSTPWPNHVKDEWFHIALVRYQDVTTIYVNGVACAKTVTGYVVSFPNYLRMGDLLRGYFDEVRISKIARWTSDFEVPKGPYSDVEEFIPEIVLDLLLFELETDFLLSPSSDIWDESSFIKLLCHFDGEEDSTTLIDSSIYNHPMSAESTAHLTGVGNVVAGDCAVFSGNNYLWVNPANFWSYTNTDFTIDFWVKFEGYRINKTQSQVLRIGLCGHGSDPNQFYVEFKWENKEMWIVVCVGNNKKAFQHSSLLLWYAWWQTDQTNTDNYISNEKFSHVAVVKKSEIIYVYVNGVKLTCPYSNTAEGDGGYQFTYTNTISGNFLMGVSELTSTPFLTGCMQNFRMSVGIARWISEFLPPTTYVDDTYTKLFVPMSGTLGSTIFVNTTVYNYAIGNVYGVTIGSVINSFGDSAIVFNGTSDYVEVPDSNDWYFDIKDFTIDFRMKLILRRVSGQSLYLSATQPLFSQGVRGTDNFIGLDYEYSPLTASSTVSTPRFVLHIGQTTRVHLFLAAYHASLPEDEKWHHIAVVSYQRKIGFYYDGKSFSNSEIYIDIDNTALGYVTFPDISAPFKIGSDGTYFYRGYIDEFRIMHRAAWLSAFNPPTEPYVDPDPDLPEVFNEVLGTFSFDFFMEVEILKPGERAIDLDSSLSLEVIGSFSVDKLEFSMGFDMVVFQHSVENHFDFVFSNFWKKEILDAEFVNTEVEGDYRAALLNPYFEFDPDVHEFFVDQVDQYEIVQHHGYISNIPLAFKEFTSDGTLSFHDLLFPMAVNGIYGPVKSLLVYDYAMDIRGQIVGCLTFDQSVAFDQSAIELSDLSFQII